MPRTKSQKGAVASGSTFAFFMGEAIIHYNMGQKAGDKGHEWTLPPVKELGKMALIVGAFSVASGVVIGLVD